MRIVEIPPFPAAASIPITELGAFIKGRLSDDLVVWPDQALPLVGYMAWPNDTAARVRWLEDNRQGGQPVSAFTRFKTIQQHWARVADIVHLHHDLTEGRHQQRRAGASIGKAIFLIATRAKIKGTGAAKLWEIWKSYKDVAHLVTAAVLLSAEATPKGPLWFEAASTPAVPDGDASAGTCHCSRDDDRAVWARMHSTRPHHAIFRFSNAMAYPYRHQRHAAGVAHSKNYKRGYQNLECPACG